MEAWKITLRRRSIGSISVWVIAGILTIAANVTLIMKSSDHLPNDWGYFNSLSLVVRSIIWNYQSLPLHNPWVCGGLDIMSNPQSRVASPFILLDRFLRLSWQTLRH